jgi:predicted nucleic acid-binding Zn ribbon protein
MCTILPSHTVGPVTARAPGGGCMLPSPGRCPGCAGPLKGRQRACSGRCRAALSRQKLAETVRTRDERLRELVRLLAREVGLGAEDCA